MYFMDSLIFLQILSTSKNIFFFNNSSCSKFSVSNTYWLKSKIQNFWHCLYPVFLIKPSKFIVNYFVISFNWKMTRDILSYIKNYYFLLCFLNTNNRFFWYLYRLKSHTIILTLISTMICIKVPNLILKIIFLYWLIIC